MFLEILLLLVLLIPLLAIVLDSQLGKALAARLERGRADGDGNLLHDRMRVLEGEVERLSAEVEQLVEQGEFLHKLLAERPPPESPGERNLDSGDRSLPDERSLEAGERSLEAGERSLEAGENED